jgi:hypothetical protein
MKVPKTRSELESEIIEQAIKDPNFLPDFRSDPKGVLLNKFGVKLPENLKLVILEDSKDTVHLVIPNIPQAEPNVRTNLSEEQGPSIESTVQTGATAIQFHVCC